MFSFFHLIQSDDRLNYDFQKYKLTKYKVSRKSEKSTFFLGVVITES